LRQQHVADVEVGLGQIWIERQRTLKMDQCLVELALGHEGGRQVMVRLDHVRLERERGAIGLDRHGGPVGLHAEEAEILQRADMSGAVH
jgi:hypothetical protein